MTTLRHNVLALGVDYGLFMLALTFASQSTILPAFAAWLGAPNVLIGAIPAVMTLGWFLPSLFAAGHTETLTRILPFLMKWTGWERLPFLVMAMLAFVTAERWPGLTLGLMLVMLLMITGVGGVLMPAWMELIARALPTTIRGRFFALSNFCAGLVGFGASLLVTEVLARVAAPASYGVCFLGATLCVALSWVALAVVREPVASSAAPPVPLRDYLGRMPALLRRDRNLSWFIAARAFGFAGAMATGFYTVYALRAWEAPASQAGVFTAMLLLGQSLGTLTLGWVGDHAGHRLVLLIGMIAAAGATAMALVAPSLGAFGLVFALYGVQIAAVNVSSLNVLLEFAPIAEARPTYVGLATTAMAPVAFAAPLVGGVLADAAGFRVMFVVALAFTLVGLVILATLVRDPRHLGIAVGIEESRV
ncbi:MAG TPA: MFS transporter [Candidatus Binatia bacterium]|nr:MFS transporter [Candidatus Binatia bacterium]